jgi:hypothetical protein
LSDTGVSLTTQPQITVTATPTPPHFPKLGEIVGYLKHHEKLIALVAILVVGWFAYGKIINYWEKHDQRVYDKAVITLQAQVDQNKAVADANAKLAADYKALAEQVSMQYAQLQQAMVVRDAATKKQQLIDRTLPPDALAARWQELVTLPLQSVQPRTDATFSVTAPAAAETVVMLEEVPKLKADLQDSQTQTTNVQGQVVKAESVITGLHTQIDGLNVQIVDQQKVCTAQLNLEKVKTRKAKRSWFVRGAVAGGIAVVTILKFIH